MSQNPGIDSTTGYYPAPYSLDLTDLQQRGGMLAVALIGFLSAIAVFWPICSLTLSMFQHKTIRNKQCLTLIYNLMFADFFHALGFICELHWIQQGAILAPSATCSLQAAFIIIGAVANALFVLAIALWTAWQLVVGRNIPQIWFHIIVGCIWFFVIVLTVAGPASHGDQFFSAAGSWCWISPDYEPERLGVHYIWIFMVVFLTFLLYGGLGLLLYMNRFNIQEHGQNPKKIKRIVLYMCCYWAVYSFCTLPIASGRMHAYAKGDVSDLAYTVLDCFVASCGWMDALVYNLTRWQDILEEDSNDEERAQSASPSSTTRLVSWEPKSSYG